MKKISHHHGDHQRKGETIAVAPTSDHLTETCHLVWSVFFWPTALIWPLHETPPRVTPHIFYNRGRSAWRRCCQSPSQQKQELQRPLPDLKKCPGTFRRRAQEPSDLARTREKGEDLLLKPQPDQSTILMRVAARSS